MQESNLKINVPIYASVKLTTCNFSSTYLVHTGTYIHVPFNKSCTSMYRYVPVCTREVRVCTKYPDLVQPVTIPDGSTVTSIYLQCPACHGSILDNFIPCNCLWKYKALILSIVLHILCRSCFVMTSLTRRRGFSKETAINRAYTVHLVSMHFSI